MSVRTAHTFTRQSLYAPAWSEPVQTLAKRFSLSDRGLAKICAAANIPVPARGYWAQRQIGKPVTRHLLSQQPGLVVIAGASRR